MSHRGDPPQTIHSSILPSFPRIRQQNLKVLYGKSDKDHGSHSVVADKSRMGHVDPRVQNLVDCINQNPKYVTLSSCSGRIALFHPTATIPTDERTKSSSSQSDVEEGFNVNANPIENGTSGKGSTGSWVFVSHDVVNDPITSIGPFFFPVDTDNSEHAESYNCTDRTDPFDEHQVCYYRFEPMLLHVAACNIEAGQFLLQVALQNGLRESGMIVTSQRVTVAFRTHSLALSIPLSFQKDHIFFPKSLEYVVSLTNELNRRLELNLQLIEKVLTYMQQTFLSMVSPSIPLTSDSNNATMFCQASTEDKVVVSWEQESHRVPELNLYGHAAIAFISTTRTADSYEGIKVQEILIFGGYGLGPTQMQSSVQPQSSKKRSESIYRLRQEHSLGGEGHLQWSSQWDKVDLTTGTTETTGRIKSQIQIFSHYADYDKSNDYETFYTGILEVKKMVWDGRLHTAAVDLTKILNFVNNCINGHISTTHVLLFGGRYGPNKPMNDLILFEYTNDGSTTTGTMFIPQDVRGTTPTPRWGHTFTALDHPRREMQQKFDPTTKHSRRGINWWTPHIRELYRSAVCFVNRNIRRNE